MQPEEAILNACGQSATRGVEEPQEQALAAVLDSPSFRNAPVLRQLLRYLWEHRYEDISEYAVATDALGRKEDFDPKEDATVRVHISRLRLKLKETEEANTGQCRYRIMIPLGTHRLVVEEISSAISFPGGLEQVRSRAAQTKRRYMLLEAVIAALSLGCIVLGVQNVRLRSVAPAKPGPMLERFWVEFFSNGKPTRLVLATPVFFQWRSAPSLRMRDVRTDSFEGYKSSAALQEFVRRWGVPELSQSYAVSRDVLATVALVQYLEARNQHISISGSADLGMESFSYDNVIVLGFQSTNEQILKFTRKTNFLVRPDGREVLNRQPRAGEPERYSAIAVSTDRRIRPGLVALVPGEAAGSKVLLLLGHDTASLVVFLTSSSTLASLGQAWKNRGSPPYFEAVISGETQGQTVLKTYLTAFRVLPASH